MEVSSLAWAESCSEALALCSEFAAFCCVTRSISLTALLICSMPLACSALAWAMRATNCATCSTDETTPSRLCFTPPDSRWPCFARLTESEISAWVLRAASLERSARVRTSSATTAKPRPASPARAASTAALSARRLVWNAMSLMSRMIAAVPSEAVTMRPMAVSISPMTAPPCCDAAAVWSARSLACEALVAVSRVFAAISSRLAEVCSRALACADEPWATRALPVAISVTATFTCSAAARTCERLAEKVSRARFMSSRSAENSPARPPRRGPRGPPAPSPRPPRGGPPRGAAPLAAAH